MSGPHLFQTLDQPEWKLVFSLAFLVEEDFADYPIHRYATPGTEDIKDWSWEELFRRTIRYLALECGMQFDGLDVYRDGRIIAGGSICDGNVVYVRMLAQGSLPPSLELCFQTAVQVAEERGLSLNLDPLNDAIEKVRRDCRWVDAHTNPEAVAETFGLRDAALAEIGVQRLPMNGKQTIH